MRQAAPPPWGVYVHVPWCRRRCSYCDFYFEIGKADASFAAAVAAELEARRDEVPAGAAQTIYLGGGTPSALDDAALDELLRAVRARVRVSDDVEVTLEANPEDLDDERLARLFDLGVTRLSLGAQSFDDDVLRWLGRAHDGAHARAVVRAAVARFSRVSVDLILGVPDEPAARLARDLDEVVDAGPGHVSAYMLTVEEGTPLWRMVDEGRRPAPSDDAQADGYERLQERLPAAGLRQYEISSFARAGEESRHNRLYWAQGTWLGLGPGAHSMHLADDGGVVRRHTTARLFDWRKDPAAAAHEVETLAPAHALFEAVAFGLRDLARGVDLDAVGARHQTAPPPALRAALAREAERGRVVSRGAHVALTAEGARFADAVAREVLYARERAP